jgi:hypothetical protein
MNFIMRSYLTILFLLPFSFLALANNGFVLITSLFNEKHEQRAQEYITCLEKNLANPLLTKIHVFYDTGADVTQGTSRIRDFLEQHPTIALSKIPHRPSFGELFSCASTTYPNEIVLVSNGDIYFNETLSALNGLDFSKLFLAIGRWNIDANGKMGVAMETTRHRGKKISRLAARSQDVWVFKSPTNIPCDDINLGTPHCDHYLAYRIIEAGYDLFNPMGTVQCCHQHASNWRPYAGGGKHRCRSAEVPGCAIQDIGNPAYKAVEISL